MGKRGREKLEYTLRPTEIRTDLRNKANTATGGQLREGQAFGTEVKVLLETPSFLRVPDSNADLKKQLKFCIPIALLRSQSSCLPLVLPCFSPGYSRYLRSELADGRFSLPPSLFLPPSLPLKNKEEEE